MLANLKRMRQQRAGQPDTPAMELFAAILDKAIIVDQFHFKCHSEDDTFCMTQTNPTLDWLPVGFDGKERVELQELLEFENSESSEQLFRWLGLLKHLLNEMAISNATFFVHRMVWLKNERTIRTVRAPSPMPNAPVS